MRFFSGVIFLLAGCVAAQPSDQIFPSGPVVSNGQAGVGTRRAVTPYGTVVTSVTQALVPPNLQQVTNSGSTTTQVLVAGGYQTVGGNERGSFATDLQQVRSSPEEVASGSLSAILGGADNTASGSKSVVLGGIENVASGEDSIVGGRRSSASGEGTVVLGVNQNEIRPFMFGTYGLRTSETLMQISGSFRMDGQTTSPANPADGESWFLADGARIVDKRVIPLRRGGVASSINGFTATPQTVPADSVSTPIVATQFNLDPGLLSSLPLGEARTIRVRYGFETFQPESQGWMEYRFRLGGVELIGVGDITGLPWPGSGNLDFATYTVDYVITIQSDGNFSYAGFVGSEKETLAYSGIDAGDFENGISGGLFVINSGGGDATIRTTVALVEVLD
jgi:hypothetical protein